MIRPFASFARSMMREDLPCLNVAQSLACPTLVPVSLCWTRCSCKRAAQLLTLLACTLSRLNLHLVYTHQPHSLYIRTSRPLRRDAVILDICSTIAPQRSGRSPPALRIDGRKDYAGQHSNSTANTPGMPDGQPISSILAVVFPTCTLTSRIRYLGSSTLVHENLNVTPTWLVPDPFSLTFLKHPSPAMGRQSLSLLHCRMLPTENLAGHGSLRD